MIVGAYYGEGPPVPIPNTEVKLTSANDTWLATARENRSVPTQKTASKEAVFLHFVKNFGYENTNSKRCFTGGVGSFLYCGVTLAHNAPLRQT